MSPMTPTPASTPDPAAPSAGPQAVQRPRLMPQEHRDAVLRAVEVQLHENMGARITPALCIGLVSYLQRLVPAEPPEPPQPPATQPAEPAPAAVAEAAFRLPDGVAAAPQEVQT